MDDPNPYAAPDSPPERLPRRPRRARPPARRLLGGWAAVLLFNLPVPLLFAGTMTDRGAKVGMAAAVVVLGLLGGVACWRSWRLGTALIVGGAAVALAQVVPLPQIIAGSIGMSAGSAAGVVRNHGGDDVGEAVGVAGGFLVTLLTGALLIKAAAAIGLLLQVITPGGGWGIDRGSVAELDRNLPA